jgi:hypothetical protein
VVRTSKGQRLDVNLLVILYSDKLIDTCVNCLARTQIHIDLIGTFSILFVNGDRSGRYRV